MHSLNIKILIILFLATLITSCSQFQSKSGNFYPLGEGGKYGKSGHLNRTGTPQFLWPVKKKHRMTRGYYKATRKRRKHYGIDLAAKLNTPIYASHPGLIVYAGSGYSGYGKVIILEYNDTWASLYAHLNKFNVREGQIVNSGDMIGFMGTTGRSTGVHLHFELIYKKIPIDPLKFLKK